MLDKLKEWDTSLLISLNGMHADWLDPVAVLVTKTEFWIPLYLFLTFLIFRNYGTKGWLIMAGVVVTIVIADQVTSSLMKPYFQRPRPSHEPALENVLHIVDGYRGGQFGFASSHAANTFGLALLIFLVLRKFYRSVWLMFVWAMIITYTRIYLGVHYPGDILVGTLMGLLAGYAGYRLFLWLDSRGNKPPTDIKLAPDTEG